jgi:diguanylate cyclase (GGDEF)-like protein
MKVGVGYSEMPDSGAAGRQAAQDALQSAGRPDPCDLALLFCTVRVNQQVLLESVREVIGGGAPIYGGGAAGIITNGNYGYAGDQVGVALIWLDGVGIDVLADNSLFEGEAEAGISLGNGLAKIGVAPGDPVLLFYDTVRRGDAGNSLLMATWLLEGIEKSLGFLPAISGAGMIADHACSPAGQFIGHGIGEHYALAMTFGQGIHMGSTIMHGCRPASAYYTVTKAEGPMILKINDRPAIPFIDSLLNSAIKPADYPFFLLFGINSGERWGDYDEDSYASRLCLGVDIDRGGIVMFEPDMVEGTEFQLMFRSMDLDYMRPKINSIFDNLKGREPVFALYIDCAGRAAGYGGTDIEDAVILQETVAGRVPLLGIYTGVEIAPVAGRPRGLDWTGVFCLFTAPPKEHGALGAAAARAPLPPAPQPPPSPPRQEKEAIRKLCEQNAAKVLSLDARSSALRYELELKRRGFHLIRELVASLHQTENHHEVFIYVAQRINAMLNMQKTALLLSEGSGLFKPIVLQGFDAAEQERLAGQPFPVPPELLAGDPVIVNASSPSAYAEVSAKFSLPNFVASPIFLQGEAVALLITGRVDLQPPYLSPLSSSDAETILAITELLGSLLVRMRLQVVKHQAETDGLTGLLNRATIQRMIESCLTGANGKAGAFLIIDLDNFKTINDTNGHQAGDEVLISFASSMKSVLRDTDMVGRMGGDEFIVFCSGITDRAQAEKKAVQISGSWHSVIPKGGKDHVTGSIGMAIAPQHGATYEELYTCADKALYKAKSQGRNCYVVYEGE